MKNIHITAELIPEEEGGYSVYCPELDIYTQGDTEEESLLNLKEAAELHLEELGEKAILARRDESRQNNAEWEHLDLECWERL
jgi:predicted RNase H-like HicB family nuclease